MRFNPISADFLCVLCASAVSLSEFYFTAEVAEISQIKTEIKVLLRRGWVR